MTLAAEAWGLAFGSLPVEDGLRLRERAEARHFPAANPGRYRGLLGIPDLDAFLATDAARVPRVAMADSSRQGSSAVPQELFVLENGRLDLTGVFAQFDGGATLVVSQFHEMHPPLARFCRGLERVFLHPVQANVYLTPPGAQGFRVHYDTHDVLVLQVQGEKLWRLWPQKPLAHPTDRTPWEGEGGAVPEGEPRPLLLKAGDALYVPRGVPHDAAVQEGTEPSLHLTIGLLEPPWADALHHALEIMELQNAALREPFPTWRLNDPEAMPGLVAAAVERLSTLGTQPVMELVSQRILATLATNVLPMLSRGLMAPDPSPRTRLRLSDAVHHHVVASGDGAELYWAGGREPLTAEELDWLMRIDRGAAPEELDGAEALAFCRHLATLGLVKEEPAALRGSEVQSAS